MKRIIIVCFKLLAILVGMLLSPLLVTMLWLMEDQTYLDTWRSWLVFLFKESWQEL